MKECISGRCMLEIFSAILVEEHCYRFANSAISLNRKYQRDFARKESQKIMQKHAYMSHCTMLLLL